LRRADRLGIPRISDAWIVRWNPFRSRILPVLYKGFSRTENIALNLAGLCAVLVALIPMTTPEKCTDCGSNDFAFWHYFFAVLLFACITFVAVLYSEITLGVLEKKDRTERSNRYRILYDVIGSLMILLPSSAFVLSYILGITNRAIFA